MKLWACRVLIGLTLAAPCLWVFRAWLTPYHQPQRGGPGFQFRAGDLTPLFSVWTQVAARALFERGEFPLWSDHIYGGEPFFAKPQVGVLSLTTLFAAILPAQVVATWTFLFHLWIAGLTSYALGIEMQRLRANAAPPRVAGVDDAAITFTDRAAALAGALSFMLSSLLIEQTMQGHGPIVLVACWTPLVWRELLRAFHGSAAMRHALGAGILVAIQVLAGGETVVLYTGAGAGLWTIGWLSGVGRVAWGRSFRRVGLVALVAGTVAFGLAAVKLLPGFELMDISNRAGGLRLDDASGQIIEFSEPGLFNWLSGTGPLEVRSLFVLAWGLSLYGVWIGWRDHGTRGLTAGLVAIAATGVLVAHSQTVFSILWQVVPMFGYQRIPQRALILFYLSWSVLIALGVGGLIRPLAGRPSAATASPGAARFRLGRAVLAGLVLVLALMAELLYALPALPPTRDIRREIASNQVLNWLSRQPGEFRIHALENRDRNWGIEHVTVPLGLSNLVGWDHLWLLDYLGAEGTVGRAVPPFLERSYRSPLPARFWGLMNVRYVTSTRPVPVVQVVDPRTGDLLPQGRTVPGLRLIRQFEHHPFCQPMHSDGPYLFENEHWMPRAWIVPHAVLVLGEWSRRRELTYQLMEHPDFDPRRLVVLEQSGPVESLSEDLLGASAVVVAGPRESVPTELAKRLDRFSGPVWYVEPGRSLGSILGLREWLQRTCDGTAGVQAAAVQARSSNRVRVEAGESGYLVLSEKFAHFPGWRVESRSERLPLLPANGVATAVRLQQQTAGLIEFVYLPTWFRLGAFISAATVLLTAASLAEIIRTRRRSDGRR